MKLTAQLPFIHKWLAVMPDAHVGLGSTVGSVIPTHKAIIPAAVGVDIGCGMMAVKTSLEAKHLPDNLYPLREAIERAVPHGRTHSGGRGDKGAWQGETRPQNVNRAWESLHKGFLKITNKYSHLKKANHIKHLGTLGSGNHFIELCLDEAEQVWLMLHSGSRGIGNRIGSFFIEKAKEDMRRHQINLKDTNLSYLQEGTEYFEDYLEAVGWAQSFAEQNRKVMMENILQALRSLKQLPKFQSELQAVNCHHNYVEREFHFGKHVFVTRKGAVRARKGDWGIIPGSMGTCSYIVRGKGNPESFHSCSHGAGRLMSRKAAKKRFSLEEHIQATAKVECRKDQEVLDETPGAYKAIQDVMEAQKDLVEIVHTLKQVLCVKG